MKNEPRFMPLPVIGGGDFPVIVMVPILTFSWHVNCKKKSQENIDISDLEVVGSLDPPPFV